MIGKRAHDPVLERAHLCGRAAFGATTGRLAGAARWREISAGRVSGAMRTAMALYEVMLHDDRDQPVEQLLFDGEDDEAAIDHAARIDHPRRMLVLHGDRIVAHFAPRVGSFRWH
jgi:hypothetical protein